MSMYLQASRAPLLNCVFGPLSGPSARAHQVRRLAVRAKLLLNKHWRIRLLIYNKVEGVASARNNEIMRHTTPAKNLKIVNSLLCLHNKGNREIKTSETNTRAISKREDRTKLYPYQQ